MVNSFLTRVKIDVGELAQTKVTNFSDRVEKNVLSILNISVEAHCVKVNSCFVVF